MISILIVLIVLIWAAPPISRQNPILPYPVSFLAKIFRPTHRPPPPPPTHHHFHEFWKSQLPPLWRGVKETMKDYADIYFLLFKNANLSWTLFKRQALFQGIKCIRYKRPNGTRWVEHQIAALKPHLHKRLIFIGFCNNQIVHLVKLFKKNLSFQINVCMQESYKNMNVNSWMWW